MTTKTINDKRIPLAYFITFRGYGTWLHGDSSRPVNRFHNRYGAPRLQRNDRWKSYNKDRLTHAIVRLASMQKTVVKEAIHETCRTRGWEVWATNVRSNHVHTVVTANAKAETVRAALKANATRKLREAGCWRSGKTPWAERGSVKYLWTEREVINAVVYVEEEQGE